MSSVSLRVSICYSFQKSDRFHPHHRFKSKRSNFSSFAFYVFIFAFDSLFPVDKDSSHYIRSSIQYLSTLHKRTFQNQYGSYHSKLQLLAIYNVHIIVTMESVQLSFSFIVSHTLLKTVCEIDYDVIVFLCSVVEVPTQKGCSS